MQLQRGQELLDSKTENTVQGYALLLPVGVAVILLNLLGRVADRGPVHSCHAGTVVGLLLHYICHPYKLGCTTPLSSPGTHLYPFILQRNVRQEMWKAPYVLVPHVISPPDVSWQSIFQYQVFTFSFT